MECFLRFYFFHLQCCLVCARPRKIPQWVRCEPVVVRLEVHLYPSLSSSSSSVSSPSHLYVIFRLLSYIMDIPSFFLSMIASLQLLFPMKSLFIFFSIEALSHQAIVSFEILVHHPYFGRSSVHHCLTCIFLLFHYSPLVPPSTKDAKKQNQWISEHSMYI